MIKEKPSCKRLWHVPQNRLNFNNEEFNQRYLNVKMKMMMLMQDYCEHSW